MFFFLAVQKMFKTFATYVPKCNVLKYIKNTCTQRVGMLSDIYFQQVEKYRKCIQQKAQAIQYKGGNKNAEKMYCGLQLNKKQVDNEMKEKEEKILPQ